MTRDVPRTLLAPAAMLLLCSPFLMGANSEGCGGPAFSRTAAPDVTGNDM